MGSSKTSKFSKHDLVLYPGVALVLIGAYLTSPWLLLWIPGGILIAIWWDLE